MKVTDVIKLLNAEVLAGENRINEEVKLVGAADLISDILALSRPGMLVLTGYVHNQIIRTGIVADLLGFIIVRGKNIPQDTIKMARENNIILLRTEKYLYASCGILYQAGFPGIK